MSVQVMRLYYFTCDHPRCERTSEEVLPRADEPDKAGWARGYLTRINSGWTFAGRLSFCPEHRRPS